MIVNSCGGAITVVNAIATGIGGAIGIKATNQIRIKNANAYKVKTNPSENSSRLIDTCVEEFIKTYNLNKPKVLIESHSDFPPARGLKTSSAISTLMIKSLCDLFNISITIFDMIKLAALASIKSDVSITGAIDDAFACYIGGFYLTNNEKNQIIKRINILHSMPVFLLIPERKLEKSGIENLKNKVNQSELKRSISFAKSGHFLEAISTNSEVYWSALYPNSDIYFELVNQLENIIGLNGTGPSLFLISKGSDYKSDLQIIRNNYPEFKIVNTQTRRFVE